MKFVKYPSIENSYQSKFIEQILYASTIPQNEIWHVQEKIHGANFSLWCDGEQVKAAKRSGFLAPNECFFDSTKIVDRYKHKMLELADILSCQVAVFGELCGGRYNGVSQGPVIQKGVDYAPHNEFFVFDLMLDGAFIDFRSAIKTLRAFGFTPAPILFTGSLQECLDYDHEYVTKVPGMLGLETLEDNITEGNIIRPTNCYYLNSGARVILKRKNSKFSEKSSVPRETIPIVLPDHLQLVVNNFTEYLNENRLNSVISKIGEVTNKDFGKLQGLLIQDALEEFNNEEYESLDKTYKKLIHKEASKFVIPIVRKALGFA